MYLREKKKTSIFAFLRVRSQQSHICHSCLPPWGTNNKSKNFKFLNSTNLSDPVVKQSFTKNITLAQCGYPFGCTHASDSSIVIFQRIFTEEINRSVKSKPSASFPFLTSASLTSPMLFLQTRSKKKKMLAKQSLKVKALVTQPSTDSLGVTGYSSLLYTDKSPQLLQIDAFAYIFDVNEGKQSFWFVSERGLPFLAKQKTQTLSKQNSNLYNKSFLASQLFSPKEYKFSLLRILLAPTFYYGKYNVNEESKAVGISKTNFVRSIRNELNAIWQQLIDNKEITLLCLPALYYLLPLMKHYYPRELLFFSFAPFSQTRKPSLSGVSQCEYWKESRVEKDTSINFFYPNTIHKLYSLQNINMEIKDFYFFKFFIYFFQFRIKTGWAYWPHRILCLPLAFHRRIVKLFLVKQKKKNIRYSKIDLISTHILDSR